MAQRVTGRLERVAALIGVIACVIQPACATRPPASAEAALAELEQRLLTAPVVRIGYRVEADGAFSASLTGELVLDGDAGVELTGSGTFGGAPVTLRLEEPAADELRQALVIGLTRMGVLHNLARLNAGRPPDHADGGVEEWVQARDVEWLETATGVRFAIEVAGQRTADAELWLDPHGNPVRRQQTVRFPGGEMRVVEAYEVTVD